MYPSPEAMYPWGGNEGGQVTVLSAEWHAMVTIPCIKDSFFLLVWDRTSLVEWWWCVVCLACSFCADFVMYPSGSSTCISLCNIVRAVCWECPCSNSYCSLFTPFSPTSLYLSEAGMFNTWLWFQAITTWLGHSGMWVSKLCVQKKKKKRKNEKKKKKKW